MVPCLVSVVSTVARFEPGSDRLCGWFPWAMARSYPVSNDLPVFWFSRCNQCHGFQYSATATPWFCRILNEFGFKNLPRVFENFIRLGAIVWRTVTVGRQDPNLDLDFQFDRVDWEFVESLIADFLLFFLLGFPLVKRVVVFRLGEDFLNVDGLQILASVPLDKVFIPPNLKGESAVIFFLFSFDDSLAYPVAQVLASNKGSSIHSRNYIPK